MSKYNIELAERLSMLSLTEEERLYAIEELSSISSMADSMLDIDTENIEETLFISFSQNITREDEIESSLPIFKGHITVPGVIE